MMASNILSRLLPSADNESVPFHDFEPQTRRPEHAHEEENLGMGIDEENLGERFQDQDLEHLLADAADSHITTESTAFPPRDTRRKPSRERPSTDKPRSEWRRSGPPRGVPIDDDDDVPESLLLEGAQEPVTPAEPSSRRPGNGGLPPPVPGPADHRNRAQWERTREQQRLYNEGHITNAALRWKPANRAGQQFTDPREKAMWYWANVQDLDSFLAQVYSYYLGHGIWSMTLHRVIMLVQTAFVVGFLTWLSYCIDYGRVPKSKSMDQILVPQCTKKIHGFWIFMLWLFIISWTYSVFLVIRDMPRLRNMHDFYHYLLDIPDRNIQTVSWQLVVARLMALRDHNFTTAQNMSAETRKILNDKSRQRMDAHDIANRLMRQENYLIALFNKEILDVTIPVPFLGNRYIFSHTTEWHVRLAIMDFVFDHRNQVKPALLKERNRRELVQKLRSRLVTTGLISIICAPFAVTLFLTSYFFKYFTEYHKDPSQLGSRSFTPFAEWKFREFNELYHQFEQRRNMAYPFADRYLMQFPKDKMEQLSGFVAFIVGAFAGVLALFTLLDSELFLGFEITPGKNVLFYLSILGVIYRIARSSSAQDDQVLSPDYAMQQIIACTRYEPASWSGRLHSDEVRNEFSALYQMKVIIFSEEILSMIITPFLLMFRLPQCSERIIDFFREFTIHVDGLGNVCSFAVFDFKKGGDNAPVNRAREDAELREDYYATKDNKMLASYFGFLDNYAAPGRGQYNGRLQGRANFHPPPVFPTAFPGVAGSEMGGRASSRGPAGRQPQRRTPKHNPNAGRSSPIHSILLDPQHQPSMSGLRNSPHQTAQGRYRNPLQGDAGGDEPRGFRNRVIEEESSIGDSWRTTRLAQGDDEEDEAGVESGGSGVLALLKQFSKAQTEGRGVGVGV